MLPRQPAWIALSVGSIITTSSAASALAGEQRRERALGHRQLLAAEEQAVEAGAGERELEHHGDGALHVAGPEAVDALGVAAAGAVALGGDGVEVAGEQHGRSRPGEHAGVAEVAHGRAAGAQHVHHVGGERALAARLRGDVDQLERPGGQPLPELPVADRSGHGLPPYRPSAMRYCGIDVSAKATNQQLCTLHERRGPEGMELVATFYEPGTVEEVARTRTTGPHDCR